MALEQYRRKRNFRQTPEPRGQVARRAEHRFVIQEHHASHLHFDFRLEIGGVLKSWAVPKGPSLDPSEKRLAIQVEDHPVDYINFEGQIKEGNYGAGEVRIWDSGKFEMMEGENPEEMLEEGKLSFNLHGEKIQGEFNLIQMPRREKQWLLIKGEDEYADPDWHLDLLINRGKATGGAAPVKSSSRPARKTSRTQAEPQPKKKAQNVRPVANRTAGAAFPAVTGAKIAEMPMMIQPMLATLIDEPFDDPEWIFETKWDGVRAICYIEDGQVRLVSRNEKEMTLRYPELQQLARFIEAEKAILDGEIVVFDGKGRPSFQLLQSRLGLEDRSEIERLARQYPVTFCVFDLLYFNTFDLMRGPLIERKKLLKEICGANTLLRYSEHVAGKGKEAFRNAARLQLEGVIAKHTKSVYVERRSSRWLKIKTVQRQEVVIAGYTEPRRTRKYFGALVAGLYDNMDLHYVGHVGGGLNTQSLEELYRRMQPLKRSTSPFAGPVQTNEPVQWIEPVLVGEVKFAAWTTDRKMRQPIFMGLRDDKEPLECTYEFQQSAGKEVARTERNASRPAAAAEKRNGAPANAIVPATAFKKKQLAGDIPLKFGKNIVVLSHLEKPYWPDDGYTKGDLLRYYFEAAKYILPYTTDRPSILKRYPNGIAGSSFFQHDVENAPSYVKTMQLEAESGRKIDYVLVNNVETLLYTANLGTIAQNPWNSRIGSLDNPDWIVFDLDPKKTDFSVVREVALAVREILDRLGLKSYPKTSGSTGMHIYVPIKPAYAFDVVADFAARVAAEVAGTHSEIATVERSISGREKNKVYVDHLQNARGKSMVSPYSVRARSDAPVSAPLDWTEVKRGFAIEDFTIKNMPARLRRKGDLFRDVLRKKQSLEKALKSR